MPVPVAADAGRGPPTSPDQGSGACGFEVAPGGAAGLHLGHADEDRIADTYGVEVAPGQDPALMLAVTGATTRN